jgi:hypothetical protein
MPEFPISFAVTRGLALAQAAESMLRAMGGVEAVFRIPVPVQADNPTQQELGLQPALTDDVAVFPVILRAGANTFELLVSPKSLEPQLLLRTQTAEEFFAAAASVQAQGHNLRIRSYSADVFAERVYLYRISVVE